MNKKATKRLRAFCHGCWEAPHVLAHEGQALNSEEFKCPHCGHGLVFPDWEGKARQRQEALEELQWEANGYYW